MAGMTSQPSMGAIVACTKGTKLDTGGSENTRQPLRREAAGTSAVSLMRHHVSSITFCRSESPALQQERAQKKSILHSINDRAHR